MMQVNMLEAKSNLSKLVAALESREQDVVVLARHGEPVAQLTLVEYSSGPRRLGLGDGTYSFAEDFDDQFDELDSQVEQLFEVAS